jgi:hypothetical protein
MRENIKEREIQAYMRNVTDRRIEEMREKKNRGRKEKTKKFGEREGGGN